AQNRARHRRGPCPCRASRATARRDPQPRRRGPWTADGAVRINAPPQANPQPRSLAPPPGSCVQASVSTTSNPTQESIRQLKLKTKREEFVSKLSVVSRAVSTRAATQALAGILISVDDSGEVSLSATDLEMGLETSLQAEAEGPGSVLLPGRLLAELARSLGDETVQIEQRESEHDVEIRSGGSSFHLRVLPAEDFPKFPAAGESPMTIPAQALADTAEVVARAASRDDMR